MKNYFEILPNENIGFGKVIEDRISWEKVKTIPELNEVVSIANQLLNESLPELTDDIYLQYSRIGDRQVFDKLNHERGYRIEKYVLAECIEAKGKYIDSLEEIIKSICNQKSWTLSSHDASLDNFYGRDITIDLHSSAIGWRLATAKYILGNKLSMEVNQMIETEIERRIFKPFEDVINGEREAFFWFEVTSNWNACCLAGVVGAALTLIKSKERRAFYIAAFEKYIKNYLKGFTKDGYCSEGLGYWGYGFSHFLFITELIRQNTKGKIDYLKKPEIYGPSLYAKRIEIMNKIYPAIADCSIDAQPDERNMYFISKRYGLNLCEWENNSKVFTWDGRLYEVMMYLFEDENMEVIPSRLNNEDIRSWFEEAGIMVCRPKQNSKCRMGVVLKGGNNSEHHNHNDVGTFIVAVGDSMLIADVGGEVYTSRTFSPRRYESKVLNSYGHSVPVINKQLQWPHVRREGQEGKAGIYIADILNTSFSEIEDRMKLNLKKLYDIKTLLKLEREFIYSRKDEGYLMIKDEFEFSEPQYFETVIITTSLYEIVSDHEILIYNNDDKIKVTIETEEDLNFEIKAEKIEENMKIKLDITRLSIKFKDKIEKGCLEVKIVPVD